MEETRKVNRKAKCVEAGVLLAASRLRSTLQWGGVTMRVMNGVWWSFLILCLAACTPVWGQRCDPEAIVREIEGLTANSAEAMRQRAENGDPHAQAVMGNYFVAAGDYAAGLKWLNKAADQDDPDAQFMLAFGYLRGWYGVAKDETKAKPLMTRAAEQGHCVAQLNLGSMYKTGVGVTKDAAKAVEWFRRSAEQGFPPGELMFGRAYYKGEGVDPDLALAEFWVRKASEHGISPAQTMLAQILQQGSEQVPSNPAETESLYKLAAEQGDAPAQLQLGLLYRKGLTGPADPVRAAGWFEKALAQGFAPAAYELATMTELGEGVPQSNHRALELYLVAADLGLSRAQVKAAQMLHVGKGAELDLIGAYKWLAIAIRLDNADAKSLLPELAREMKKEQIAKANAIAEDWAATHPDVIAAKGFPWHQWFKVPSPKPE